ncbi:hypothetical protein HaLaN_29255, partial [Haematococcus lacustris]
MLVPVTAGSKISVMRDRLSRK